MLTLRQVGNSCSLQNKHSKNKTSLLLVPSFQPACSISVPKYLQMPPDGPHLLLFLFFLSFSFALRFFPTTNVTAYSHKQIANSHHSTNHINSLTLIPSHFRLACFPCSMKDCVEGGMFETKRFFSQFFPFRVIKVTNL